ncbi:GNAT family N-acetyltransferase [Latilactobacillus graminis]|nr:GNAT family N-acetyltransferase [Latilactobacillus graminis]
MQVEKITLNSARLKQILAIWLAGNLQAHAFIPATYWEDAQAKVATQLPQAEIWTISSGSNLVGFAGVVDRYLAGFFIVPEQQHRGVGRQLLTALKEQYPTLMLAVYVKNQRAVRFYQEAGFVRVAQQIDAETNEIEQMMRWSR